MVTSLEVTKALLSLRSNAQPACSHLHDRLEQAAMSVSNASTQDGNDGRDQCGLPASGVDADEEALRRPCLFLDLRPFMDVAPPSVRCATCLNCTSIYSRLSAA